METASYLRVISVLCCGSNNEGVNVLNTQDKATLERQCRQNIPELKAANELEFGFNIRCCSVDCMPFHSSLILGMVHSMQSRTRSRDEVVCECCRDKQNPKNWYMAKNVTIIPPAKQLRGSPLDNMKAFFAGAGN